MRFLAAILLTACAASAQFEATFRNKCPRHPRRLYWGHEIPRGAGVGPGCCSAGSTEEEARQGIREAIQLYLAPSDLELPANAKLVEVTIG
jgi:hypothetical protein